MEVLIVEDDDFKLNQISTFIASCLKDIDLTEAKSVNAGTRALRSKTFDLILLDMSLPTYTIGPEEPGWRPQGYGGRDILRFLARQETYSPVIVITQFDRFEPTEEQSADQVDIFTLKRLLDQEHPNNFIGLVYFSAASDAWKKDLTELLNNIDGINKEAQ